MIQRLLFACLTALCIPSLAIAGSLLELATTDYREDPPRAGTIEISTQDGSSRMEMDSAGGEDAGGMIFLGGSGEMIALDHEEQEYFVLDRETLEQMAAQVGGAMQQMQEALKDMPPEQRAMAEQMMKQRMPQMAQPEPTTLQETSASDSINGFDCRFYEIHQAGRKISELCVADWSDIEGGREASESMLQMADFFRSMADAFSEGAGIDVMGDQQNFLAHLQELDGYPVLAREFDDAGELSSETRLESAKSGNVDSALFEPPAEYRERSLGL